MSIDRPTIARSKQIMVNRQPLREVSAAFHSTAVSALIGVCKGLWNSGMATDVFYGATFCYMHMIPGFILSGLGEQIRSMHRVAVVGALSTSCRRDRHSLRPARNSCAPACLGNILSLGLLIP